MGRSPMVAKGVIGGTREHSYLSSGEKVNTIARVWHAPSGGQKGNRFIHIDRVVGLL